MVKRTVFPPYLFLYSMLGALLIFGACSPGHQQEDGTDSKLQSDLEAMALARQVIEACGGQTNWDSTRYVMWRNFGKRLIVWDKWTGDIRVENPMTTVVMNLKTREGRAWKWGSEITEPNELHRALDFAYEAWQYDSHDIFLPFLLTEDYATLKIVGEEQVNGYPADILEMTFDESRPNPTAKYHLYIDKESKLLVQWDYYMDTTDAHPRFSIPWRGYKTYGKILISHDRGKKQHTDVAAFDELPVSVLKSPDPVDTQALRGVANTELQGMN